MKGIVGTFILVLSCALISTDIVTAQSPTAPSNPLGIFSFNPQEVAKFLWSSLKPQYEGMFRNKQVLGNASVYVVQLAKGIFPGNATNNWISSKAGQEILDVIDSEMVELYKDMDTQTASIDDILKRLTKFDLTKILDVLLKQSFIDLQSSLNANATERLIDVIDKLENDQSIASDLQLMLDSVPMTVPMSLLNASNFVEKLDVSLRELTKVLKADPNWKTYSAMYKLRTLLMRFNYKALGMELLKSSLKALDSSLPSREKSILTDFINKLHNKQALNMTQSFPQGFPLLYNYIRDRLNMTMWPQLPTSMDFAALKFLEVFDVIEEGLEKAMEVIKADTNISFPLWSDTKNFTQTERLVLVLQTVDYASIGQGIMGNVIKVMEDENRLRLFTYGLVTQAFNQANITTNTEELMNTTADILVDTLHQSVKQQRMHTNWTKLSSSEQLGKIVMGADWMTALRQLFVAVMKQEDSTLSASMRNNIQEMYTLVDSGNVTGISHLLAVQLDKFYTMLWRGSVPSNQMTSAREAVVESIANQMIETNKLIENGKDNTAISLLNQTHQTFANLTDLEKLAYIVVSMNYTEVGETVKEQMDVALEVRAGEVLHMLERRDSIVPAFESFVSSIEELSFLSANMSERIRDVMNSSMMKDVMGNINNEMVKAYIKMSANTTVWTKYTTNREKLMSLLQVYDYASTGDVIIKHVLAMMDSSLSGIADQFVADFINIVQQRQSVFPLIKDLRNKIVERYPVMSWMSVDSLLPVSNFLDQHIQNLTKKEFDAWSLEPGKLPKVYAFFKSLNYTNMYAEMLQGGLRLVVNTLSGQLVPSIPKDNRKMMVDVMNIIEAGVISDAMADMFKEMSRNNSMLQWAMDSTLAHSIMDSMASSISDAYKQAKKASDTEWRFMSSEEKLLRVLIRMDKMKMLSDAFKAASETASPFLNPPYSEQCSADLSTVQYAMGKAMSNPGSYFWAIQLADSWGKPPEGILQGRFVWPGDMIECEKVKGDRIQVVNASTDEIVVLEKDGIKGAWSMANIEIPVPAGSMLASPLMVGDPKVSLNWGICLPASCNYTDTMKFIGRVKIFGAKVPYVKRHSDYPVVTGEYKHDSKFIGVSIYFGILVGLVTVCTFIDKLVLMKREEKRKQREAAYAMSDMNNTPTEKLGFQNGGYVHDEKSAIANGTVENGAVANGGVVEHKPDKKKAYKPGVGIQLLKSFSLYENLPKLMDSTNKPNQLQALDGIRFLSMTWVILGHTYAFIAMGGYTQNLKVAMEFGAQGDWTFMGVSGGLFAVDSFFLLSGLLVGYLFLKVLDKVKGKVSCFTMTMYYVHRYIRLLPLYASAILIAIAYSNYIGNGPFHGWFIPERKNPCDSAWWTNLLYVNNVIPDKMACVGWGWYLANDMQFYVISPLLLLPLYRAPKVGITLISLLWTASLSVTAYLWSTKGGASQFIDQSVMNDIYIKPWCRIGPYLMGLLLAYMLFKKIKVKSVVLQAMWWIVSLGLLALVVYIPYDATKEKGLFSSSWNSTQRAIYESLCKNAWALALGWIIFASNTGCGGFIGDMLSWGGWAPLSRLTYAAYLVHPFVLDLNYKNRHNLIYVGNDALIFDDIAFVTITYMASLVLHLLVEAPMLGLEKILLPRK